MEKTLTERIKIFMWGMGGFMIVAVAAYTINIADVRDIDIHKIITILIVSASGYILNQLSKYLNTSK